MARYFDGSDDKITYGGVSGLSTTAPITVACWIKNISGGPKYILSLESASGLGFVMGPSNATNEVNFGIVGTVVAFVAASYTFNTLAHYCATYDGNPADMSTAKIYINGTDASITRQNGSGPNALNGVAVIGGRTSDNARQFYGDLAELGVWNRALSVDEIKQLAAGFSPLTIPKGLKFAPRLAGTELLDPITGKLPTTTTGTTVAAHPSKVKWRSASNVYWPNPATAPSGFKPAWWTPPKLIGAGF